MTVYPWLLFGGSIIGLLLLSYIIYHYFVDPQESYVMAMVTVMLSLSVSILCALLIPVDIYVISEGNITSESLHVTISQEHVQNAYLALFSSLLFLAFCLVPYAYFYGEDRGGDDFDKLDRSTCWSAFRSAIFFLGFMLVLLGIGLNFRPGHRESMHSVLSGEEDALRWLDDLLDMDHRGLNALSFAIACLTLIGVMGWVEYTAYGLATMPLDWLKGKQTAAEQRQDVEINIADIREKYRAIQSRYGARDDGTVDLSRMKAADRKELNKLGRKHKNLVQHNYKLQELEQKAGACIPAVLQCLVPFRQLVGVSMMSISLLLVLSLLLTLLDRLLHSPCGLSCGYTLKERQIYNPADELFLTLSVIFPMDFIVLGVVVLFVFASTLYGIVSLGIRVLCVVLYALKARQTSPQALLVMCNAISYILLALCMALLTIAPDYTAFGSQTVAVEGSGTPRHCTLSRRENGAASCQISVIAAFFGRIAVAMPFFSVAYFFANWAFIGKFCVVFILGLFCQQRQPFTDTAPDGDDEEEIGLLAFN